jgi:hypothetical protein
VLASPRSTINLSSLIFRALSESFAIFGLQPTTKVPATKSVQGVEASLDELLTKIRPRFST